MKIRTRLLLIFFSITTFVVVLTGLVLLLLNKQQLIDEMKEQQIVLIKGLGKVAQESVFSKDIFSLINYLKNLKDSEEIVSYAFFMDTERKILAHTDPAMLRQILTDNLTITAENSTDIIFQDNVVGGEETVDVSIPVLLSGQRVGTARIGFAKDKMNKKIRSKLKKSVYSVAVAISLTFLLSFISLYFVAISITKPIKILAKGAEIIGSGKLDTRIKMKGKNEFVWLAKKFNEMAEKLQEIDELKKDFVSSVTHELRSPIAAIESYVNVMIESSCEEAKKTWQEDLMVIKNNSMRLLRFVNDLLDTAKIDAGRFELNKHEADLGAICDDIMKLFSPRAKEYNITLDIVKTGGLQKVFVDEDRIVQVISNLLSNALKFTPSGGKIVIEIKATNNGILLTVTDNGPGIPKNEQNKIFEKFHQAKGVREVIRGAKGTGLGLYIVKHIIELHKGKIILESPPSGMKTGTRIGFELPVIN